jgi:hypothetical protein
MKPWVVSEGSHGLRDPFGHLYSHREWHVFISGIFSRADSTVTLHLQAGALPVKAPVFKLVAHGNHPGVG